MNPDACEKKIGELRNSKDIKSLAPGIPVAIVMQEAINLHNWCKPDREILIGTGFDWKLAEDIPIRVEALGKLETLWASERLLVKQFRKEWKIALPQALRLRTELLHHFRFAFRSRHDARAAVKRVSKGNSYADMIQDLCDLSALGKKYQSELKATGFNMDLLDRAYKMSFDLGSLLGSVNNESTRSSENQNLRNKAYYHLKEAVDTLRKAGQYAFWQNEERLKGYSSAYIKVRNLKYRKKDASILL